MYSTRKKIQPAATQEVPVRYKCVIHYYFLLPHLKMVKYWIRRGQTRGKNYSLEKRPGISWIMPEKPALTCSDFSRILDYRMSLQKYRIQEYYTFIHSSKSECIASENSQQKPEGACTILRNQKENGKIVLQS